MMKGYLLDVNVLLALAWPNHVHHQAAHAWFNKHHSKGWATCSITQLGFVRLSSHPKFTHHFKSPQEATKVLEEITHLSSHQYWHEEKNGLLASAYTALAEHALTHSMITDTFLIAVASHNQGKLATFEQRLSRIFDNEVECLSLITG
jgi:uncharacterized protein